MIRLKDLLNEVTNGTAPYGVLFLNDDKMLVGDNHKDPMPLSKDLFNKIMSLAKQYGYYGEGIGIEYNKGIIQSDIYKALKDSEAKYMGSWDDKIKIPDSERYTYCAVLFSNSAENDTIQKVIAKVKGKETIFELLVKTFDLWGQEGIGLTPPDLKRFLIEMSEKGYDFYKWSQKPATESNLKDFIETGEELMWPEDKWDEYPNKAGKLARRETMVRDSWLVNKAPNGVYFIGNGHLIDISKMTGKKIVDGSKIGQE